MLKKYLSHYYAKSPLEYRSTPVKESPCKRQHERRGSNRNNIQYNSIKPGCSTFADGLSPQQKTPTLAQQSRVGLKKRNTWSSSSSNSSHTSGQSICSPNKSTKLPEIVTQSAGGDISRRRLNRNLSVPPCEARVDAPRVYDPTVPPSHGLLHRPPGRVSSAPGASHRCLAGSQSHFRRCIGCMAKGRELNCSCHNSPAPKNDINGSAERLSTLIKHPLGSNSKIDIHRLDHAEVCFPYTNTTNSKWKEQSSDKRPPWFPAGKGGSAVSHHKQLQMQDSRQQLNRCPNGLVEPDNRPCPQKLSPLSRLNRIGQAFANVLVYTTSTIKRKCMEKAQIGRTTVKPYRSCCESLRKMANADSQGMIRSNQSGGLSRSAVNRSGNLHSKSLTRKANKVNSTIRVGRNANIRELSKPIVIDSGLHNSPLQKPSQPKIESKPQVRLNNRLGTPPSLGAINGKPDCRNQQKHSAYGISPMQHALHGVAYPVLSKADGRSPTMVEQPLFGGCTTNLSVASNSHMHSLEPVTYASLWDNVQEVHSSCMSQTQQPNALSKNKVVVSPVVSQETLLHVTEVSETNGHLDTGSSFGSKLNTLAFNEDYSDSDTWKASDDIDISRASTWKSSPDKPTSHLVSPQQVNILPSEYNCRAFKQGDCELSGEKRETSRDIKDHGMNEVKTGSLVEVKKPEYSATQSGNILMKPLKKIHDVSRLNDIWTPQERSPKTSVRRVSSNSRPGFLRHWPDTH